MARIGRPRTVVANRDSTVLRLIANAKDERGIEMRPFAVTLVVIASVAISAQSSTFQRGELVQVVASALPPGGQAASDPRALEHRSGMLLKVVAIPNDRIRMDTEGIYVNDVRVTGFSPDFIARVMRAPERVPTVVPEGHYFVMGEHRINLDISEYSGQHYGGALARAAR